MRSNTISAPAAPTAPAPEVPCKRIIVAVDDLFFLAKIQETARQLGVRIECLRSNREILEAAEALPALIIFDLNGNAKPLATIAKIRRQARLKKIALIGFVSHLQAELKMQAQEAGCDLVMPRSAFSQNLPALLRRHGLPESE